MKEYKENNIFYNNQKKIKSITKTYYHKNKKSLMIIETKKFNMIFLLNIGNKQEWKEQLKILKKYKLTIKELNNLCKYAILRKEI